MIQSRTTERYTPEDLLNMPEASRYELVDGQLVEREMSTWSSYVAGNVHWILKGYCQSRKLAWVFPADASYQCFPAAPQKVRRPDVSVIRLGRMSAEQVRSDGHNPIVPDLAVEVVSPNDLAYEVEGKVQEFLGAGCRLVWVVYPNVRTVDVHRAHGQGTSLRDTDDLDGEDVLPGFRCRVAELFQMPDET